MLLSPFAVTLIPLDLFGDLFGHRRCVYGFMTDFALISAVFDFLHALPKPSIATLYVQPLTGTAALATAV